MQKIGGCGRVDHILPDIGAEILLCQGEEPSLFPQILRGKKTSFTDTDAVTSCCYGKPGHGIPVEGKAVQLFLLQILF